MKIKTQDLYLSALDWAVAQCKGLLCFGYCTYGDRFSIKNSDGGIETYAPSFLWSQGGEIIQRERIGLWAYQWNEQGEPEAGWYAEDEGGDHVRTGCSPLVAAMRCFVASKMGDEVEIPDELIKEN